MFRMYGRKVEILKYQISYTENEEQRKDYAASEEEANEIAARVRGTVSELPAENDVWMDGIVVADVPDTYGEAVRIREMGQTEYEIAQSTPDDPTRLSALEAAMLSLMTEVQNNV